MKIKYSKTEDILTVTVNPLGKIDYATEQGDFIVHFSKNNKPVLFEILNASRFLAETHKYTPHIVA